MPIPERIINTHVHTFTGEHIPNLLAKGILPWPLYYLVHIRAILGVVKRVDRWLKKWKYEPKKVQLLHWRKRVLVTVSFQMFQGLIVAIAGVWVLLELMNQVAWIWFQEHIYTGALKRWGSQVTAHSWIFLPVLVLAFILSPKMRLLIIRTRSMVLYRWLRLDATKTAEFFRRYFNIVRYTLEGYGKDFKSDNVSGQNYNFKQLKFQYPPDTRFVILPMDMEYMGAGKVNKPYRDQMEELFRMKQSNRLGPQAFPFVFAHPERIRAEANHAQPYFSWTFDSSNGRIEMDEQCFLHHSFQKGCVGIKLYPALGYYPFDPDLLPLWLWCAQEGIPITSHCVVGSIHYRGRIRKGMRRHPIFKEGGLVAPGKDKPQMALLEKTAKDFQVHWTHPLNYLVLLEPDLLAYAVQCASKEIQDLFGLYTNTDGKLSVRKNLRELKINLAHFGGADEWERYLMEERTNFHHKLEWDAQDLFSDKRNKRNKHPDQPNLSFTWLTEVYQTVDWFTLITGLMRGFPNVYSDISHTLHDERIVTLLKTTLDRFPRIRQRTLFGTDFYVVRNYDADKKLLTDLRYQIGAEHFRRIAERNPVSFLKSTLYNPADA